jgi:CSLREA domain-containing protein
MALTLFPVGAAQAATFSVNSSADTDDGNCTTAAAGCTLREAINAANNAAGDDAINFSAAAGPVISLDSPLPMITTAVNLQGPGSSSLEITRSASASTAFRVLNIQSSAPVSVSGLTVSNGLATGTTARGGGIFFIGISLAVDGVVITGNHADASSTGATNAVAGGGGLAISAGAVVTVRDSTIESNETTAVASGAGTEAAGGGGILSLGSLTVERSTITGNQAGDGALGSPGGGGGISNNGTLTVINSTLDHNGAVDFGGGIDSFGAGSSTTLNSDTISENTANTNGDGYGNGGGTQSGAGPPSGIFVSNTLYWRNRVLLTPLSLDDQQCAGFDHISSGYNIRSASATPDCGGFTGTGDTLDSSTWVLSLLGSNGGPTQTRALPVGADPIDIGNPATPGSGGAACPATDQRGLLRTGPAGRCDIGAFELNAVQPPPAATGAAAGAPTAVPSRTRKKCKKKKRAEVAKKKRCKRKRRK